jgi:hypothetical protein
MVTKFKDKSVVGLIRVVQTKDHIVRVYNNRLAIWRKDGHRMTWEELQSVKQELIGDRTAIEVFPAQCNVINLRHTRHLWHSDEIQSIVAETCRHPEFNNA